MTNFKKNILYFLMFKFILNIFSKIKNIFSKKENRDLEQKNKKKKDDDIYPLF